MKYVNAVPVSLTVIYFNIGNKLHQILNIQTIFPHIVRAFRLVFPTILDFIILLLFDHKFKNITCRCSLRKSSLTANFSNYPSEFAFISVWRLFQAHAQRRREWCLWLAKFSMFTIRHTLYVQSCDKRVPVTTAWCVLRLRMEERPPIWRVAANILNKQSRTVDKGWSSWFGVGRGANNSSLSKRILLLSIHRQSLGPGLIIWYDKFNKSKFYSGRSKSRLKSGNACYHSVQNLSLLQFDIQKF
jgi:hypothetical protein